RMMISMNGFPVTAERLVTLAWAFPPVLLFLFFWKRRSPGMNMFLGLFAICVLIFFFYPCAAGGPGPRFFFAYFPFLILAVVELHKAINHSSPAVTHRVWNVAIVAQIICSVVFATEEAHQMYARRDLQRTTSRVDSGKNIFLLKTR